tara:strand:- start:411 stop:677 length:267 start_codon:yes stop_codon:yes gene_type:complete
MNSINVEKINYPPRRVTKVEYNRQIEAKKTYDAIIDYSDIHGHTPTYMELAAAMGLGYGAVRLRVDTLKEFGWVQSAKGGHMVINRDE